jgi:hypothetical protein
LVLLVVGVFAVIQFFGKDANQKPMAAPPVEKSDDESDPP